MKYFVRSRVIFVSNKFIICPALKFFAKFCERKKGALKFILKWFSKKSKSVSIRDFFSNIEALLTKSDKEEKDCFTLSIKFKTLSIFERSH